MTVTSSEFAETLIEMVRKEPTGPHAGSFARAAADLLASERSAGANAEILTSARELLPELFRRLEEAAERQRQRCREPEREPIPEAERQIAADLALKRLIGLDVARTLLTEATSLERLAALGREPTHYGSSGLGASLRATLPDEQRRQLSEAASSLRRDAAAILVESGVDPRDLDMHSLSLMPRP